jgi:hypothetical protein
MVCKLETPRNAIEGKSCVIHARLDAIHGGRHVLNAIQSWRYSLKSLLKSSVQLV